MKRFDADENKFVDCPHGYDEEERDGWSGDDGQTLFYLTDDQSNGRWLYVDRPDEDGEIELGIARVYTKHLSPEAARAAAAALIAAADQSDAEKPEREARENARRLARSLVVQTCSYSTSVPITWGSR